jgi:nitrogen regulatory protein P-II
MKAVVVVTESEAMQAFERAFLENGDRGFTIVPTVVGRGRTGLKAGGRVHPGGASILFTVLADEDLEPTLAFLRGVRDAAGAQEQTKLYVASVHDVSTP